MTEITKETRNMGKLEIREVGEGDDKQTHIQGYALIFDSISEDMGFREVISRGALDNCDMSNVILKFNHNDMLARNSKTDGPGSLILAVDDKGLFFDAIPTDTSYARDLITNMESGIVSKCSFAFNLDYRDDEAQTWDWAKSNDDFDMRTIHKIAEISDISIVVNPAYESTSSTVYKRSKEEYGNSLENEKLKRRLSLELDLI